MTPTWSREQLLAQLQRERYDLAALELEQLPTPELARHITDTPRQQSIRRRTLEIASHAADGWYAHDTRRGAA